MERHRQIIDVAVSIIAELGLKSFTIRNLSQRIGVTEGAIYRHFKSKEDIFKGILEEFELLSEYRIKQTGAVSDPVEELHLFLADRYKRFVEKPELARILFMENVFQSTPELAERSHRMMKKHFTIVQTLIQEGKANGTLVNHISDQTLFRLIIGPMRLLVTQWILSGQSFNLAGAGEKQWRETAILIKN
jgi:TetR/AcrR family fatty acid metabolism transcriptional regulator